jgi:DNA-binding Xre family transcriptional regulator
MKHRPVAELARLRSVREKFQGEKPSLEQALAESPGAEVMMLGELLQLHELAARLKQERERQKLTLGMLAKRTGIDAATLSRLETGRAGNPTVGTLLRIAGSLGKVVNCVLQDAPTRPRATVQTHTATAV